MLGLGLKHGQWDHGNSGSVVKEKLENKNLKKKENKKKSDECGVWCGGGGMMTLDLR
jgi:hypothetical protein